MASTSATPGAGPSGFPYVSSKIDYKSPEYAANLASWAPILKKHSEALLSASSQGGERSLQQHTGRGQMLARDRVSLLLDEQSPFLELGVFAGHELKESTPSASLITGIGVVNGVPVMVIAHIPSLNGGAWNEFTVRKQNRATEIATMNGLPIIAFVQSAGVFLPQQFRVFHIGGQIFRDLACRTKYGLSSCAVVFGSSTAGGAYHPALSDYTIFVQNQAQVFLGGPPLVKMATGEIVGAEELGGAEMHAKVTGLADQLSKDEFDAIRKARDWVLTTEAGQRVGRHSRPQQTPLASRYQSEELLGIANPDIRSSLNMMEVILRIVDDSRVNLFKPLFGVNMITAWAHINGHLTGIIANQQPVINPKEAEKSTQFIQLCNQGRTPIIFLHNVTGFMVGKASEQAGLIKKGAQFVSAVSTSSVPHISIICGSSYGAGNYAMCGRAYGPRFIFAWPNSRCSVMGPDQLSGVMENITRASANRSGKEINESDLQADVLRFKQSVERDSEAYMTSAYLIDDGIIDPRDTRDVLGMCLEIVKTEEINCNPGSRSIARL